MPFHDSRQQTPIASADEALEQAQETFNELFRRDAGAELGRWFCAEAQLMWPEVPGIIGPEAIGRAFAEFAETYETVSFEAMFDLVEIAPSLAVVMGPFMETRRERETGVVERVHGRIVHIWRADPARGWLIERLMTSRYAETELLP